MRKNITFSFRYICNKTKNLYRDFVDTIRSLSVLDYLGLATSVACVVSCLFALIQLIRFIVGHGFTTQIDLIKEMGVFSALDEIPTTGTVPDYYNLIFCIAMGVLLIIGIVIAVIEFFRKEKIWRKVLTTIIFVPGIASIVLFLIDYWYAYNGLRFFPERFYKPFHAIDSEYGLALALFLAGIVFMIGTIILLLTAKNTRENFFYAFGAVLIVFGILPLVLLMIENLIGIAIIVVVTIRQIIGIVSDKDYKRKRAKKTGKVKKYEYYDSFFGDYIQLINVPLSDDLKLIIKNNIYREPCVYTQKAGLFLRRLCEERDIYGGRCKLIDADTGDEIPLDEIEHIDR